MDLVFHLRAPLPPSMLDMHANAFIHDCTDKRVDMTVNRMRWWAGIEVVGRGSGGRGP